MLFVCLDSKLNLPPRSTADHPGCMLNASQPYACGVYGAEGTRISGAVDEHAKVRVRGLSRGVPSAPKEYREPVCGKLYFIVIEQCLAPAFSPSAQRALQLVTCNL